MLFDILNNKPNLKPEYYGLLVVKAIFDADKTKTKEAAHQHIVAAYHIAHPASIYHKNYNLLEIPKAVKRDILGDPNYKLPKEVDNFIKFIKDSLNTNSLRALKSAEKALEIIGKYIENLTETVNEAGTIDSQEIGSLLKIIKELPTTVTALEKAREEVEQQAFSLNKGIGQDIIGSRETPKR